MRGAPGRPPLTLAGTPGPDIVPRFPPPPEAPGYFAIVETTARYHDSAHFGDVLSVLTTTEHLGNRSFTLAFRIVRSGTTAAIAEGRSVQVWLDEDRRAAPVPEPARRRLEASMAPAS